MRFENRVLLLAAAVGLPATIIALVLLVIGDYGTITVWTVGAFTIGAVLVPALMLRERMLRPINTLSNLLAALLEGEYSMRSRGAPTDDALGHALLEINALGDTLRQQRLGALEASALLRTVIEEIDVAVFAFDDELMLRLVNRAGERLLDMPTESMTGRSAEQLGLLDLLGGSDQRIVDASFPGGHGRWQLRRSMFRLGGAPHRLLVLSDLSKTLREEELLAWQRLIRVLSHEINNSLAPIKSIAGSLGDALSREPRAPDTDDDLRRGLHVIAGRSEALQRFMASYAQLARLPAPRRAPMRIRDWVHRVVALETRMDVTVVDGPDIEIRADGDQLDQLLINLVRNGVDAALETEGSVSVGWERRGDNIIVRVCDDGPGLADTTNLFVPFFTTKPSGSGIGLPLSRQIVDAHGGFLGIENRTDARGTIAHVTLPIGR